MSCNTVNDTFGFELLYKIFENQINKKEDVLIVFVHWYFVKNGYKCLGSGDSKTINPDELGSELLPDGWNQNPNYSLRYVKEGKLYILMGIKSEADLLLNLLRIEDQNVTNVQFPIDLVQQMRGTLYLLIPSHQTILNSLKNSLIEPLYSNNGKDISTQTAQTSERIMLDTNDPLRIGPPHIPARRDIGSGEVNPLAIGRNDLDPLGGIGGLIGRGGGMLFDPFGERSRSHPRPGLGIPGRLPPGAIPPGAIFDPFGPPDVDIPMPRLNQRDGDHFSPPGADNMYM